MTDLPKHIANNFIVDPDTECWVWQRVTDKAGYGRASLKGKTYIAHRLVYTLMRGEIPQGLHLDHLCRNKSCVNPSHLEPVTAEENNKRSPLWVGNRTHCPRCNSELTWDRDRNRCMTCRREKDKVAQRAKRKKLKEAVK